MVKFDFYINQGNFTIFRLELFFLGFRVKCGNDGLFVGITDIFRKMKDLLVEIALLFA